jgi:hypothetical protein
MKPFTPTVLNLASQPFRRERARLATLMVVCALLSGSLLALTGMILHGRAEAADLRRQMEAKQAELRRLQGEQGRFSAVLTKPQNADVFATSVFLNELIARRGVSWTRVFKDLETVMPGTMRLLGIRLPQAGSIDGDGVNRVQLDMFVGTTEPEAVIRLLKNLQESNLFGEASMVSHSPPSQNDPLHKYRVTVAYAQKL